MVIHGKAVPFLILGLFGFLTYSCAGKKEVVNTPVLMAPAPASSATVEPVLAAQPTPVPFDHYVVVKGDSLWKISGQPKIYGDSFLWPLIFKANRDQIQDPDLIDVGQNLAIDRNVSESEKQHAKTLADETPKYVPHDKPYKKLLLDYF